MMMRALALLVMFTGAVMATSVAAMAQSTEIPPDTVTTIFVSDSIEGFGAVGGIAADALGYVYIADFRNAVWRLSPDGEVSKFADGLYGASGNTVGPSGDLFQSNFNGNFIARITRTGHWERYASEGLNGPVGIAANPEGELFVVNCTGGTVSKVDTDGRVTSFSESEMFSCPNGITFDDGGDLFVVNFNSTKVVKITPDGTATEFTDIPGAGGNGHIAFARGAFFVTKLRGNQIFRISRDGSFSVLAGTGQAGSDDGSALEATFTRPNGIAVTTGGKELWINDLTVQQPGGRGSTLVTMRRLRLVTLSDVLAQLDPSDGPEPVQAAYSAYHEARPGEDTTAEVVTLGYQWLQGPNWPTAVELFAMSAEHFSGNANAQFHSGEAYRFTGQPLKAAEQYKKVLELQPDHAAAAARLAEVTGG